MTDYRRQYEVDILIRGVGNVSLTKRLLSSIRVNTDPRRYMITHVDNGSNDDNGDRHDMLDCFTWSDDIDNFRRDGQAVFLPFNHGSVRAINIGLAMAFLSPAPYALLMDNDTEIPAGDKTWLDRWLAYFDDPKVGAVGAVSDYVSGMQHCESTPDLYMKDWKVEGEGQGQKEPFDMPLLVSFACLYRKEAMLQVGAFDERFEPGNCEDYDYSLRLREAGWKQHVANSVWVHHKGSQTFKDMGFQNLLNVNFDKLVSKWGVARLKALGVEFQEAAK